MILALVWQLVFALVFAAISAWATWAELSRDRWLPLRLVILLLGAIVAAGLAWFITLGLGHLIGVTYA